MYGNTNTNNVFIFKFDSCFNFKFNQNATIKIRRSVICYIPIEIDGGNKSGVPYIYA